MGRFLNLDDSLSEREVADVVMLDVADVLGFEDATVAGLGELEVASDSFGDCFSAV